MANLKWNTRTYNGTTSNYVNFVAKLVSVSTEVKTMETENSPEFRNATVEFEGEIIPGIMYEKNHAKGVTLGTDVTVDVSTIDGKNFFTTIAHRVVGTGIDADKAASLFGFTGLMQAPIEAELELEDSRD